MTHRVAITGLGAITPVGNDVASTWEALVAGRSGIGELSTFDSSTYPVRIAGVVKDFKLSDSLGQRRPPRHLSRVNAFGVAAAAQALQQAGAGPDTYDPYERGVSMGCSVGRMEFQELVDTIYTIHSSGEQEYLRQPPSRVLERDANIGLVAIAGLADCHGPMIGISTACSASAHALGEAYRCIQEGDAKLMITGGFDSLTTYLDVLGFTLLGALNDRLQRRPDQSLAPIR